MIMLAAALVGVPILSRHPMWANEGGVGELQLRSVEAGYYLWIASMVAVAGGAVVRWRAG